MNDSLALTRLMQLASPLLPVGAFAYSQGLEAAVENGDVRDAAAARRWILDCLELGLARFEAPILLRLHAAWRNDDMTLVQHWNMRFLASRESAELHAETVQMGFSLRRLLLDLESNTSADLAAFAEVDPISYPAAFAFAAARWNIPARDALTAYLWSWCENQVSAALKAVPLGQVAGQKILVAAQDTVARAIDYASALADDELANMLPALAITCAKHETQYSRLFRS
jgi:urease accessory protein